MKQTSTLKNEYEYLYKEDENEGIVDYGNDFKKGKVFHGRDWSTFFKLILLNRIFYNLFNDI